MVINVKFSIPYIFLYNFRTTCTCTVEDMHCLLNICYMFRPSLHHPQREFFITSQNHLLLLRLLERLSYRKWKISYVGFFYKVITIKINFRLLYRVRNFGIDRPLFSIEEKNKLDSVELVRVTRLAHRTDDQFCIFKISD
jgi:hypothetical protein